ncbi:hypothetical protein GGF39_002736, partial [Coemansia sp. RSA 1721]
LRYPDRRPCTPPPILQLIIYDRATGEPISLEHIDTSFFTATCSLYSVDMDSDMDLIRQQRGPHDSGHGSSTSATTVVANHHSTRQYTASGSLASGSDADMMLMSSPAVSASLAGTTPLAISSISRLVANSSVGSSGANTTSDETVMYPPSAVSAGPNNRGLGQHLAQASSIMSFTAGLDGSGGGGLDSGNEDSTGTGGNGSSGDSPICTVRNLIGASVTTGAKLQNIDGSLGIFFVFPDLSIRKDGEYRFRFSFFDLKSSTGDLLRTSASINARTFSDPFRVYSAKQFPGMIESTALSKHFAKQGVKIPVRKETIGKSRHTPDEDDWQN